MLSSVRLFIGRQDPPRLPIHEGEIIFLKGRVGKRAGVDGPVQPPHFTEEAPAVGTSKSVKRDWGLGKGSKLGRGRMRSCHTLRSHVGPHSGRQGAGHEDPAILSSTSCVCLSPPAATFSPPCTVRELGSESHRLRQTHSLACTPGRVASHPCLPWRFPLLVVWTGGQQWPRALLKPGRLALAGCYLVPTSSGSGSPGHPTTPPRGPLRHL